MKKTIFYLLLAGGLAGFNHSAWGQLTMSPENKEPVLPSTQNYEFVKYGTIQPSLYTGTVNYTVPLYTYTDPDFEIPISIQYASNGLMPSTRASEVGLGWTLEAGGCITREIRGIPDEFDDSEPGPFPPLYITRKGFLYTRKKNLVLDADLDPEFGFNITCKPFLYKKFSSDSYFYEIEPDIFHFRFGPYSGSFYFWLNNQVKVFNASPGTEPLKIQTGSDLNMDKIFITTPDGYRYMFQAAEFTPDKAHENTFRTYVTWKLKTITAPNGRVARFQYNSAGEWKSDRLYNYRPVSICVHEYLPGYEPISENTSSIGTIESILYTEPVSDITIDNTRILFTYVPFDKDKYCGERAPWTAGYSPKLSKISVMFGNDTVRKYRFEYQTAVTGSGNIFRNSEIPFLSAVSLPGEGTFRFEYYDRTAGGFPFLGSFSTDHWGYYNGKNDQASPADFMKNLTYNTENCTETISGNLRDPDFNYAVKGMLKQITYPTGGYSLLTYESHDYSRAVIRNLSTQYLPVLQPDFTVVRQTGGVRIKKIENFTQAGKPVWTKSYLYRDSSGNSTGILLNSPRYGVNYFANSPSRTKYMKYCSLNDIYGYNRTHIEYTGVQEVQNDGGGFQYVFSNYGTHPDYNEDKYGGTTFSIPTILLEWQEDSIVYAGTDYFSPEGPVDDYLLNLLTPPVSMQPMRGKLLRKNTLAAGGGLLREEIFQYDTVRSFLFLQPAQAGETMVLYPVINFNTVLTSQTVTDHLAGGTVTVNEHYTHNSYGQRSSASSTDSRGNIRTVRYQYLTDLAPSAITSDNTYQIMADRNVVAYPLSKKAYGKVPGGTETMLEGESYTYTVLPNNIIRPHKTETYNPVSNTWHDKILYSRYDAKGNLLETRDPNGIKTGYIWGYGGLYLIARGVNASYEKISMATELGTLAAAPLEGFLPKSARLELKTHCPNAEFEFYEYKPLVGITKSIDSRGLMTFYEYTPGGKLKAVKDEKTFLQQAFYYSTENK